MKLSHKLGCSVLLTLTLAGCAKNEMKEMDAEPKAAMAEQAVSQELAALYEAHHDGRIYVFYDQGLYKDFIKTGHTAYMFARIGGGPNGETLKFALTSDDKKKLSGIPSVELIDGVRKAADNFYGETYAEGRIYVFGSYEEMANFRKIGEAPLRYTDIGAGPNGETVVYALNSSNKKKKPAAMIEAFKKMNQI